MMDEHERDLFERTIRSMFDSLAGRTLEESLRVAGWHEALSADPRTAISVLFELAGERNANPSIDPVVTRAFSPDDLRGALVLPPFGSCDAPAVRRDDVVVVRGLGTAQLLEGEWVAVATRSDMGTELLRVPMSQLDCRPIAGMDPGLGLIEVTATLAMAPPTGDDTTDRWEGALALGQLALSHQLVGAARSMLWLARDHAVERVQFDRPIASFQAVRLRLADSLVTVEAAEASLSAAWEVGSPFAAAVAKGVAGRSARVVSRHAQQVLAGIGFTAEHPLHRFVKRTLVLDQLLGASATLTRSIGEQLVRARELPAPLAL
jgi:Acyl-CoA dehydrogenase, C-terminal domain